MDIELIGLTSKQKVFCDVMWAIETREGVENFITSLPQEDQNTCRSLIELMQLSFLDEIEDVTEASELLARF